ncbi:chromate efflux transporter [uncultured Desulfobulbus sp.]|uniref:chromate efflux transporter n=1 Tax=uncultured Desulfobulbus sp. TaxID=239745 RepID=UPI0029C8824F|nr:chromate efflux transporter [uncultured Desulfobulbus sp.]
MVPPTSPHTLSFLGILFYRFFRLGLTAFGGPAMIAYIRDMAVQKEKWLDQDSFKQGVAICQTIPGATAMQMAAYVGLRAGGAWGAIAAYVGFGLPAFVLMVLLSALYGQSHDLATVVSIFAGLQVIVVAMVAHATVHFGRSTLRDWRDLGLGLVVAGFLLIGGNPLVAILAAALLGWLLFQQTIQPGQQQPQSRLPLAFSTLIPALLLSLALILGIFLCFFLDQRLFDLALMMTKIDFFAFGGGYASVPLMFNEVVTGKQWMTSQTFMDGIALGQVTPGPIVITATFVGFLQAGLPGAFVATAAIFAPSLILLTAVVPTFDRFRHNIFFQRAMHGILVSFTGLLLSVTLRFALAIPWNFFRVGLVALALLALWRKVDILWMVLAGTAVSALLL